MKKLLLLLSLLLATNAWAEARGLECRSEAESDTKVNSKESYEIYWYRIDFDKGRVLYNSNRQNFLTKLQDLLGDKLRGDASNLYWRENKNLVVNLDRQTLEMTKQDLNYKCLAMTEDQVIRKRDAYFKEILKKNKI
mgnify:CR=1 FL=1